MRVPLLALALAGGALRALAAQDTVRVVVVATSDVHGRVFHWDYVEDAPAPWGLTRAATVIDSLRRAYPGRVVVVDAGDLIQGNPFATYFARQRLLEVHPVVDALNAVGYDAAVPGNHEFNWGLEVFDRAVRSAAFPIVAGNVYRLPRDTLAFPAFVVLPRREVRIGIAGFTTPGSMVWDGDRLRRRLAVRRIPPEAASTLAHMERAGADLRVVVIHSGMDEPSSYDTTGVGAENVAALLARISPPPHLVVVGHSHRTMADSVIGGVHFIQPPPHARGLAVAHVWLVKPDGGSAGRRIGGSWDARRADPPIRRSAEPPTYEVVRIVAETVSLAEVPADPVVSRRLAAAHEEVRNWVSQPIATAEGEWLAWYGRAEDTPIIDFVNEVQRRTAGTDLSATAAFNLRARLGPGDVRLRDLAGLYPYENELRAVRIDGAALRAYLEQSAAYFHPYRPGAPLINDSVPGFNFDVVSGVEYALDLTQPRGARVRQLAYQGRPVQPTDTFTLALNDYRQGGGGAFAMLRGLPVVYRGGNIRDLLVDWARTVGRLRAQDYFTPSWRIVPAEAAEAVRAAFGPPPAADARAEVAAGPPVFPDTVPAPPGQLLPFEPPARPEPPVAEIKLPLAPTGPEHALGRVIADAYRAASRADVALVESARIAAALPSGPVRRAHVAAVLPEPRDLVRVTVRGRQLRELLERALEDGEPAVHVSGVVVRYDPARRAGRRVRGVRFADGRGLDGNRLYEVSLAAGPGSADESAHLVSARLWLVLDGAQRAPTGVTELEAVIAHLGSLRQPVDAPPAARFRPER
jgi:2',3'-cyclic-nucleotide 2'-phosphodiesterase/3'-nucleotidase